MSITEAPGKTRHCAQMLAASAALMELSPQPAQQRILGRYAFLYGDAMALWASRWRKELARGKETERRAKAARASVAQLRSAQEAFAAVRDYLSAKRQPKSPFRADDVEDTLVLWRTVDYHTVVHLFEAALACYDALDPGPNSLTDGFGLPNTFSARFAQALPSRQSEHWYLAADTGAELRPYTLTTAQGGPLGQMIAQINDVGMSLDLLLRVLPVVRGHLPYDLLIRSALVLETSALMDLVFGPASGPRTFLSLIDLCRYGRADEAFRLLEQLRETLLQTPGSIRWLRNRAVAHLDDEMPLRHLHDHLLLLDVPGVVGLAEHLLTWLDAIACADQELRLLMIGERPIRSWPITSTADEPARGRPQTPYLSGAISHLLRQFDSPYLIATGSNLGSAIVAGLTAGRRLQPRTPIAHGYRRPNPLEHPPRGPGVS